MSDWTNNSGRKDDAGKDPWRLLPFDALRAILKVLAFGADKYGERNWERGMDWSRPFDALLRHATAWWEGESKDPETGFSHLWHLGCCALFLIAMELRGIGRDNRPSMPLETKEEALPLPKMTKPTKCKAAQYGDRTHCKPCGLEWDTNDPEAPNCMWKLPPPQQKGFDPNAGTVCTHCGWTDGHHHVGCLATAKPGIA